MSSKESKYQNFIEKANKYQNQLMTLQKHIINADAYLKEAELHRCKDVEYSLHCLGIALQFHCFVSTTQGRLLLSITSDMCHISKFLSTDDGSELKNAFETSVSHAERTYVNVVPKDIGNEVVDRTFEIVNANGSRVYSAILLLQILVNSIIGKMESLKQLNFGNEIKEGDQKPIAIKVEKDMNLKELTAKITDHNNAYLNVDISSKTFEENAHGTPRRASSLLILSNAMINHQEIIRNLVLFISNFPWVLDKSSFKSINEVHDFVPALELTEGKEKYQSTDFMTSQRKSLENVHRQLDDSGVHYDEISELLVPILRDESDGNSGF